MHCVRNTQLENHHAGWFPETLTGDFSDVKVIDGHGKEIPWNDISRISDPEMKAFMKEVVNKIYTYLEHANNPHLRTYFNDFAVSGNKWDAPELDESFMYAVRMEGPPTSVWANNEPK